MIEAMARREVRLSCRPRKFIPGASELAVVAAINSVADCAAKLDRNRSREFDGQVRNAAACVEPIGRQDRTGRAGGQAGAAAAAVSAARRIERKIEIQIN